MERDGKVRIFVKLMHKKTHNFHVGSDTRFCTGKSTRTLHPARNILVRGTNRQRANNEHLMYVIICCHRDRMNLKHPIYFSTGLTEKVSWSDAPVLFVIRYGICYAMFCGVPGKSLLQAFHNLDQSEDPEHFCTEKHVRIQTHQGKLR